MKPSLGHDLLWEEIQAHYLAQLPFLRTAPRHIGWRPMGLSEEQIKLFEMKLKQCLPDAILLEISNGEITSHRQKNYLDALLLTRLHDTDETLLQLFDHAKYLLKPNGYLCLASLSQTSFSDFQSHLKPLVKNLILDGQALAELFQKNAFQDTIIHTENLLYRYKRWQTLHREWSEFLKASVLELEEKQLFSMGKMPDFEMVSDDSKLASEKFESELGHLKSTSDNLKSTSDNLESASKNAASSSSGEAPEYSPTVTIQLLFAQTFTPDLQSVNQTTQTPNETRIGLAKLREMVRRNPNRDVDS